MKECKCWLFVPWAFVIGAVAGMAFDALMAEKHYSARTERLKQGGIKPAPLLKAPEKKKGSVVGVAEETEEIPTFPVGKPFRAIGALQCFDEKVAIGIAGLKAKGFPVPIEHLIYPGGCIIVSGMVTYTKETHPPENRWRVWEVEINNGGKGKKKKSITLYEATNWKPERSKDAKPPPKKKSQPDSPKPGQKNTGVEI